MIVNKVKDNPKLKASKLSDGRLSLYLEYHLGSSRELITDESGNPIYYDSGAMKGKPKYKIKHSRRKEVLKLYLIDNPRTSTDRNNNKEIMRIAEAIRFEKAQELLNEKEGYRLKKDKSVNFIDYFQDYINRYTKRDLRTLKMALSDFKAFLNESNDYRHLSTTIKTTEISKDLIIAFTEWLRNNHKGEGANTVYKRFKKVINYAIEHDLIKKNPCTGIVVKVDENKLTKAILSLEEIELLMSTHYKGENDNIKRAFLFCCFTGLRFCDVKDLTFANIDYSNKLITFEQNKTKGHSSSSSVVIQFRDDYLKLIGKPTAEQNRNSLIFDLPSYISCCNHVKKWVQEAGIDKHITWHCARHSFALNILNNGANIKVVSNLLGHSSLRHTEKYVRAVDSLKKEAINSLPEIKI